MRSSGHFRPPIAVYLLVAESRRIGDIVAGRPAEFGIKQLTEFAIRSIERYLRGRSAIWQTPLIAARIVSAIQIVDECRGAPPVGVAILTNIATKIRSRYRIKARWI